MKVRILALVVFTLVLFTSACSTDKDDEISNSPSSAADLVIALETKGFAADEGDQIEQPFFSVPAKLVNLAESGLQVFEYPDAASAQSDADLVAPDGSSVGTSMPFWVGEPHFFKSERLIVLYLGDDPVVLSALEEIMGAQFAGN